MRFGGDIVLFNVQDSATMAGNYTILSAKLGTFIHLNKHQMHKP
jgi:hypothetical protein